MEKIIENIANVKNVKGALLVGKDGLVIASSGDFGHDPDFVGASISELYSTAEYMSGEKLESGMPTKLTVETETAKFMLFEVNSDAVLVVIADQNVFTGLIYEEAKSASGKLKESLE